MADGDAFWKDVEEAIHAGGPIKGAPEDLPTRKSLVCHYALIPPERQSLDPQFVREAFEDSSYFKKL